MADGTATAVRIGRREPGAARGWERGTRAELVSVALLGLFALAAAWPLVSTSGAGIAGISDRAADFLFFAALLAHHIGFIAWHAGTRRVVARCDGEPRTAGTRARLVARFATLLLIVAMTYHWHAVSTTTSAYLLSLAIRLVIVVFFAIGIVRIRHRVRAVLVDRVARPAPTSTRTAPREVVRHARTLADDAFWAALARRDDREFTVLEWLSDQSGRWHRVGADPVPVRDALLSGAYLVAYPGAPRRPGDGQPLRMPDFRRAPVALIVDADNGALRFDRLREGADLDWWLPRAHAAAGFALYPVDPADVPGALSAVMPPHA